MIKIDTGSSLYEILLQAEHAGPKARLDIAIPFIDCHSQLWKMLINAAKAGVRIRLITRPLNNHDLSISEVSNDGIKVIVVPKLHAKAVLLSHVIKKGCIGWIGSFNFTTSSEKYLNEMGVCFSGGGDIETSLLQQALQYMDCWESTSKN